MTFLVAQTVNNLPAVWETQVRSLGWEDPLEKGKATHCSILAWKIPRTEKPGRLQSMGSQRVGHDLVTKPPVNCHENYSFISHELHCKYAFLRIYLGFYNLTFVLISSIVCYLEYGLQKLPNFNHNR